jgi:MFS family permease
MTFTAPQIILYLGYTAAEAQLLTIPIYVVSLISLIVCARLADRYRTRWKFIVYPYAAAIVGFIGLLAVPQSRLPGLTYAFLFPVTAGCYPGVITVVAWIANNLAPTSKRACGLALSLMMANFGGAIGSNIFLASEAPRYWTGYGVSLGCLLLGIVCTLCLRVVFERINHKRDQLTEAEVRAKYTEGGCAVMRAEGSIADFQQMSYWIWATILHCTDTYINVSTDDQPAGGDIPHSDFDCGTEDHLVQPPHSFAKQSPAHHTVH